MSKKRVNTSISIFTESGAALPLDLPVEVVVWVDAEFGSRMIVDPTTIMTLVSVGFLVHEDRQKIILLNELEHTQGFQNKTVDYMKIPKSWIITRHRIGSWTLQPTLPKKGARRGKAEAAGLPGTPGLSGDRVPAG